MPSDRAPEAPGTRRLHPISLLFIIGSLAWSLLVPGIVVLVFASAKGNRDLWIMLIFVPALVGALLKYWSFRYRLEGQELVVREGIVFRNERHIPYARIQNIDLVQNPLHRLFSVAEVRLETAGGEKPEAVLRVLSLGAVDRMRARVFAERRDGVPARPAPDAPSQAGLLHHMPTREVLLFGLISNKGLLVVAAAMGLVWQTDLANRWIDSLSEESLKGVRELVPNGDFLSVGLIGLGAIVALVVLMRLLSVAWALVKFHGFRLQRQGDDLRAEYGLWSRVSKTIPRHRIQVLSTREGLLHRRAGRAAIQVETAGSSGKQDGSSADRLWLAPLVGKQRVAALLREALPDTDLESVSWRPVSSRARRRLFRLGLYWLLPLTALAVWGLGVWGLIPAVVLAGLAHVNARLYVEHTAYALVPGAVLFRSGWWVRRMSVARFSKIQTLHMSQSPFDRRHAMASVGLDTAGATGIGSGIQVSFLDVDVAAELMDRLAAEAGRTAFRW